MDAEVCRDPRAVQLGYFTASYQSQAVLIRLFQSGRAAPKKGSWAACASADARRLQTFSCLNLAIAYRFGSLFRLNSIPGCRTDLIHASDQPVTSERNPALA